MWGDLDEDGYVEGEFLDGRRGLVPSNYITKLVGEDLMEFHQSMVLSGSGSNEVNFHSSENLLLLIFNQKHKARQSSKLDI